MKIVITTPILYDPHSAFNHLFRDILEGLLQAGHEITRIAAVGQETGEDYKMGLDGITYIPVVRKSSGKSNIISRYLRDTLTNIRMAFALRKVKADVLLEDISYSSFWSVFAAKHCGMRVVTMIQDIWPDNAVQGGLLSEGSLLYRYFEFWQRYVYRKSDTLLCISDDMKSFIESKNIPGEKIQVIYNWSYTDASSYVNWDDNGFVKKYNLDPDVFYAVYAGNIGRMQNVELIVKAAKLLEKNGDIHFLIIGDGVKKQEIQDAIREQQNITMLPLQPPELAAAIYSCAGVNLVPLLPGVIRTALPSKTGVVLSCGQPAVFAFGKDCAFAKKVNENGAGIVVSSDSPEELAHAILQIKSKREPVQYCGGLKLFEKHFIRSHNIARYVQAIEEQKES